MKVPSLPKFSSVALIFNHGDFELRGEVTIYSHTKQNKTKQKREKHDPAVGRIG